jgi:hypothetical protein
MLGSEAQQRVREALRKIDQSLAGMVAHEEEVLKHAQAFRDSLFGAFQFIESESMTMQEMQLQVKREGKQQLQVTSRGRPSFMLVFDPELAYDVKPPLPAAQGGEAQQHATRDLAARLFAVFTAPNQGLLRYYSLFSDGSWKRTTFAVTAEGVQPRSTLVPRATPDILALEAIDLLGYALTAHATWSPLAEEAETLTMNTLQDRTRTRIHLSGLGAPKR